jgi:hypothetical protein
MVFGPRSLEGLAEYSGTPKSGFFIGKKDLGPMCIGFEGSDRSLRADPTPEVKRS